MGIIGSAFVGLTRVYGAGENRIITPDDVAGLLGWYDADDYTSGTTWTDKSGNSRDLTLDNSNGTYSKDASTISGPSILFSGGAYAVAGAYNSSFSANEFTHIEIFRPSGTLFSNDTTFVIGSQTNCGSLIRYGDNIIGVYAADTGYHIPSVDQLYSSTKTAFVTRRVLSGFNNTSGLQISYADSNGTSLTHYGPGDFVQYTPTGTDSTFSITASPVLWVASSGRFPSGNPTPIYNANGYYGVVLVYDGILTDEQVETIYNYYKDTYNLG